MKRAFTLFFSVCTGLAGYAQPVAPDFTLTDTEGLVHHLYGDYLSQGKTVMIKIFFTTCPPCNAIAPLMEPFYQSWGAGGYDVEFFEITDKPFDTDALVSAYAAGYGETFPAISVEGGALEAVQPYKSGAFGPFLGTPTFIVIAPDGTVQFGISGPGHQATITAIDNAIYATGAVKPGEGEIPVTVSGDILTFSGSGGVKNAVLQIVAGDSTIIAETSTDDLGNFQLAIFESQVEPGWTLRAVKTTDPFQGISTPDIVHLRRHILRSVLIQHPMVRLAGDVDGSGQINVVDALVIQRLLLGQINHFPDGQSWVIVPADTDFGVYTNHAPVIGDTTIPVTDILNGSREPRFIAAKKGNINP